MTTTNQLATPFFGKKLTLRQFLTRWIVPGSVGSVLGLLALLLWTTSGVTTTSVANDEAQQARLPVDLTVGVVRLEQAGPKHLEQRFTGIIKSRRASALAAKGVGRVDSVLVEMGDRVVAGQLLVQLDQASLNAERKRLVAELAGAEARLSELRNGPREQEIEQARRRVEEIEATLRLRTATYDRSRQLAASSAVSKQELDESRQGVEATRAQLAGARQSLDLLLEGTRDEQLRAASADVEGLQAALERVEVQLAEQAVVAPYDGVIQSRWIDEGAVVSPGQTLLQIVETEALELRVGLPPELLVGEFEERIFASVQGEPLAMELAFLSPAINEATRTREVVFSVFPTNQYELLLGQSIAVTVQTPVDCVSHTGAPQQRGFWLPKAALSAAARGLWSVFIAVPDTTNDGLYQNDGLYRVERRQVELLRSQGEWVEVSGPLSVNELLVVAGNHKIVAGQLVAAQVTR